MVKFNIPYKYFIIFFILLGVFNLLDVVTTYIVLNYGGIEGNPAARFLFDNVGMFWSIIVKILMTCFVIWCLSYSRNKNEYVALSLLAFVVGITAATVYSNFLIVINLTIFPP